MLFDETIPPTDSANTNINNINNNNNNINNNNTTTTTTTTSSAPQVDFRNMNNNDPNITLNYACKSTKKIRFSKVVLRPKGSEPKKYLLASYFFNSLPLFLFRFLFFAFSLFIIKAR